MKIRVLGCSGSIAAGSRTTSFLLDDDLLVDAGTGVGDLSLEEMARVDDIVVSHSHLDHVLAIGLLADSVIRLRSSARKPPVRVRALPETLAAVRAHLFNGIIWPDFTRLPSAEHPVLEFVPFAIGDSLALGKRRLEVLKAEHTVPAVGFAVWPDTPAEGPPPGHDAAPAWVFSGDTGPNPGLWERLRAMNVGQLVIEAAFSDEERTVARISGHLCPATLGVELAQLAGSVEVLITHIKPGEVKAVMRQVQKLGSSHRIRALATGELLTLGSAEQSDEKRQPQT